MLLFAYRKLTVLKGDSLGKQVESRQNFSTIISFAEIQLKLEKKYFIRRDFCSLILPPTKKTSVSSFLMFKSFINKISGFSLSSEYSYFYKENNTCCGKSYLLTMVRGGNEKQKEKNPTIKMMGFLILSIKKWFGWTIFKNPLEIRVLIGKHSLLM